MFKKNLNGNSSIKNFNGVFSNIFSNSFYYQFIVISLLVILALLFVNQFAPWSNDISDTELKQLSNQGHQQNLPIDNNLHNMSILVKNVKDDFIIETQDDKSNNITYIIARRK